MPWRPLLEGGAADRARALVEAIADELDRRAPVDPSLGNGQAGIAILHGVRARAGRDDGADRAFAALQRALADLGAMPRPWLFYGTTGVAFAVHHLADVIGDAADVLAPLDGLARRALALERMKESWDLTHGYIGLGVYGLARGARSLVAQTVAHLAALAEHRADGVVWRTYAPEYPDGYVNLGLAHGVACAIAFLAEAHAAGHAGAGDLAHEAVRWLRARVRDDAFPRVPMFEPDDPRAFTGTLDGWCYGDLSTALVLVRAGRLLDEPTWIDAGHALARAAARRTDAELARLTIDTSLCHGAISHAHLFNRLGQAEGDDELLAAARRWYARALADDVIATNAAPGLQLGIAGVALGLLAATSDVEPAWDAALLVSSAA